MARPAVLDDTRSVEAYAQQTPSRRSLVQIAIIGSFVEHGPMTDEQLVAAYNERRQSLTAIPKASPQSIRSRRAELRDQGVVVATDLKGTSEFGNPATVWALKTQVQQPLDLQIETPPSSWHSRGL